MSAVAEPEEIPASPTAAVLGSRASAAPARSTAWIAHLSGALERRWWPPADDATAGPAPTAVDAPLAALSLLYGTAVAGRDWCYRLGILPRAQLPRPVISVGNIVVGGSGKTTVVAFLARRLAALGLRVGILSRGYRRRSRGAVIVSRGNGPETTPDRSGDEPWLLARLTSAAVAVAEQRFAAGSTLLESCPLDLFLLDDGFQHRQLHRDADIVVVDAAALHGNGHLLPRGPLREPLRALARAAALWIVGPGTAAGPGTAPAPLSLEPRAHAAIARWSRAPVLCSRRCWTHLHEHPAANLVPQALRRRAVVAACAVGSPAGFLAQLKRHEADIAAVVTYPDHYPYSLADAEAIAAAARSSGTSTIVTTAKDWAKLEPIVSANEMLTAGISWWIPMLDLEVDESALHAWLSALLDRLSLTAVRR